jgi:membrane protease YdiL (CAAX protease family)
MFDFCVLSNLLVYLAILIVSALLAPSSNDKSVYLHSALLQFFLLFVIPAAILKLSGRKIFDTYLVKTLSLKTTGIILLCGISSIPLLEELNFLQHAIFKVPAQGQEKIVHLLTGSSPFQVVVILLTMAILPAVCEESFFRGFLFSGFGGDQYAWSGIVLTSLLFGVFHLNPFTLLPSVMAGLLLGFLRAKTRSLLPPIIVHFLINGWSILVINTPLYKVLPWSIHLEPVPFVLIVSSALLLLWIVFRPRLEQSGNN